MFRFFNFRAVISCLLIGMLSGVVPATAAQQPGTLPASGTVSSLPPALGLRPFDVAQIAPLPRGGQQPANPPAATGATAPSKHHMSRWVWVAIVAGAGVGAGAGILAGNKQSGKTAAVPPTATISTGGGVTAGPP